MYIYTSMSFSSYAVIHSSSVTSIERLKQMHVIITIDSYYESSDTKQQQIAKKDASVITKTLNHCPNKCNEKSCPVNQLYDGA